MASTSDRFHIPSLVFEDAVRYFWAQRDIQTASVGSRQEHDARGGRHLDGVQLAIVKLMVDHGVSLGDIYFNSAQQRIGRKLGLPGYFRPAKQWDLLVIRDEKLLAAMELKAQVGTSIGNNFNNRAEEAIGSAEDLWTAYREHAFGLAPQPWLGYLFILEEHRHSTNPVRVASRPHFKVFSEYEGSSYAKRYELLCRKLVLERKYSSACLLMSKRPASGSTQVETSKRARNDNASLVLRSDVEHEIDSAVYSEPCEDLGANQFLTSLLRHVVPE